jgi:hypothetical protein
VRDDRESEVVHTSARDGGGGTPPPAPPTVGTGFSQGG